MSDLDEALLRAHAAGDGAAMIDLYARAAEGAGAAEPFFLTQAWIFALEAGDPRADTFEGRLKACGRA